MDRRTLDRYALAWLFGWPADGVTTLRGDLALTPQLLRLAWRRRQDIRTRSWCEAAHRLAVYFSGGDSHRYRRNVEIATSAWTFDRTIQAFRAARRQVNVTDTPEHRFAQSVVRHRARLLGTAAPSSVVKSEQKVMPSKMLRSVNIHSHVPARPRHGMADKAGQREELRAALATPKELRGPGDRDACDGLFAAIYAESPWLSEALTTLWHGALDHLAQTGGFKLPPLVLAGPPGCGKTHVAERLGALSGCTPLRLDMSTATATFMITGAEFTWSSSDAGRPIRHIAETGCANPVIILDEMDKRAAARNGGDAAAALLPLLQANTAKSFQSPYLEAEIDLSHVSWLICVNDATALPEPLRDRVRIIHCEMPQGEHLSALVARVLGPDTDREIVHMAAQAIACGKSLRWLERLSGVLRAVRSTPILH